ncbi:MAG: glycoside hydrolase family 3 N-terminal domain-containing protein [Clostridia bacterium]|nr:glycoside hydrolase family 3 N-terminal domain-containing protein [Clostridia bacterium]
MLNPEIEKKIDELLSKMTLHEKLGQLNQQSNEHGMEAENREMLKNGEIGSFICNTGHFGPTDGNPAHNNRKYVNELQKIAVEESRLGIPVLYGKDVIHGHNVVFPIPLAMAAGFDPDLVRDAYTAISEEAANDGIRWSFSPMMDLSRDPRWGRCVEGYGEDPYLGSKMAAAAVEGFQGDDLSRRENLAACAKHYIGYGAMEGGRDYQKSELSDYALRNYYLPAFKSAVDAGLRTVMSSFNEISGEPTTSSHYLLTELLRDELGFDGFVVSDYNSVLQLKKQGVAETNADAARMSVSAGVDMDMADRCYLRNLEKEVAEGRLDESIVDEAVRRVLRVKFELGLFENPYVHYEEADIDAHKALALRAAEQGMVLLKNKNGALPLSESEPVGFTGDFLKETWRMFGAWTLDGVNEWANTLEEAVRKNFPEAKANFSHANNLIDRYDGVMESDTVVLALGGHPEGEASGLATLEIPEDQKALIKKARMSAKKLVGVFFYGRPMALGEVEPLFDAILWCWHSGTMTADAAANILYGKTNPSGRLPMSFPRVTGQIPIYYNCTPSCRNVDEYYPKEPFMYKNYRDTTGAPLYPFGHGLSYTAFEYSDVSFDKTELSPEEINGGKCFEVSVKVKNTGDRTGDEVVQCYIRDKVASMMRPLRQLEGFERITLAPGEEKTVTFRLGLGELGFYGKNGKFAAEKGDFTVFIGGSSYAPEVGKVTII